MGTMNFYDARTIDDMIAQIRIDIGTGSGKPGEGGGASSAEVTRIDGEVKRIDGEVAKLKTEVTNTKADVLGKLDKNDSGYVGLQQRVATLEAGGAGGGGGAGQGDDVPAGDLARINGEIAGLKAKDKELQDALANKVEADNIWDNTLSTMSHIEQRVGELETKVNAGQGGGGVDHTPELNRLDGEIKKNAAAIKKNADDIVIANGEVLKAINAAQALEGPVAKNTGDIATINGNIASMNQTFTANIERIGSLEAQTNAADLTLVDITSRVEALEAGGGGVVPGGEETLKATEYNKSFLADVEYFKGGHGYGKFWWNPGGGNKADGKWQYLFGQLHLHLAIQFSPSWFEEPNFTAALFRTKVTTEILRDKITYKNADEQNPGRGLDWYLQGAQAFGNTDYDQHTALEGIAWPMTANPGQPSGQRGTPCRVDIGPETLTIHADRNQMNEVDWRTGMYVLVSGMV